MSLYISDFNLFLYENCNPPEKSCPLLPSNPPLKVEFLSSPPFLKIWLEAQPLPPPSPCRKGGCPLCISRYNFLQLLEFHLTLSEKNIFVMDFPFHFRVSIIRNLSTCYVFCAPNNMFACMIMHLE